MNIIEIFEKIACTVHHKIDLKQELNEQCPEMHEAFFINDATKIKNLLGDQKILADRTTIFQLN